MDSHLVWKDEFNIGIKIIDDEHKRLFQIINKLLNMPKRCKELRIFCIVTL